MAVKPLPGAQLDRTHPLAQGLVGCWLMNEGGGLSVYDYSGNDAHGALTNGPTWEAGPDGGALRFDGSDDYVSAAPVLSGLESATITVRVNQPPRGIGSDDGVWVGTNVAYNAAFLSGRNFTGWQVWINKLKYQITENFDSTWHTYTTVFVGGALLEMYRDGLIRRSYDTSIPTSINNHATLQFGRTATSLYSGATISHVHIHNRALSADEIAWLHAEPYCMFARPDRWRRVFDFGESGGIIRPRGPRTLRVGPRMIFGGVI